MDTLFHLEIETGIARDHYLNRPVHEILGILRRLKKHLKEKADHEAIDKKNLYNALGSRRRM
jgi:hypothetical protein